jgi:hypothetical protein
LTLVQHLTASLLDSIVLKVTPKCRRGALVVGVSGAGGTTTNPDCRLSPCSHPVPAYWGSLGPIGIGCTYRAPGEGPVRNDATTTDVEHCPSR